MKQMIVIAMVAISGIYFIGKSVFQGEEDKIRGIMNDIELNLSKRESEGPLAMANKVNKALIHFKTPVNVKITYEEEKYERHLGITDKEKLKQSIAGMKLRHKWFTVNFEDTKIVVDGIQGDSTGRVRLKFRDSVQGRVYSLFNLHIHWEKSEGDKWLIVAVEASPVLEEEE